MSDKKKPKEKMADDEMDVNAAQQIFSGAKQALYNEDYTVKDEEPEAPDSVKNQERKKKEELNDN